jgi:hypothetical protein
MSWDKTWQEMSELINQAVEIKRHPSTVRTRVAKAEQRATATVA